MEIPDILFDVILYLAGIITVLGYQHLGKYNELKRKVKQ